MPPSVLDPEVAPLRDGVEAVGGDVGELLDGAVGPADLDALDRVGLADAEAAVVVVDVIR